MEHGLTRSQSTIMHMGRWKSEPSALLYQEQSSTVANNIISVVGNLALFTSDNIILSRLLA